MTTNRWVSLIQLHQSHSVTFVYVDWPGNQLASFSIIFLMNIKHFCQTTWWIISKKIHLLGLLKWMLSQRMTIITTQTETVNQLRIVEERNNKFIRLTITMSKIASSVWHHVKNRGVILERFKLDYKLFPWSNQQYLITQQKGTDIFSETFTTINQCSKLTFQIQLPSILSRTV